MMDKKFASFKHSDLHFVYAEAYRNTGSTIMRGEQLSKIVKSALPNRSVFYSPLNNYSNSILFITKGAIQTLNETELGKLQSSNNLLMFDAVDWTIPEDKIVFADVLVAASAVSLADYKANYSSITSILIDHHADPRLEHLPNRMNYNSLQVGYFGELVNANITPRIEELVDFVSVSTRSQSANWIDQLMLYNAHYAVRSNQKTEGYKPFLKGFIAAHTGSNIIVQSSQDDAVRWLGKDYPYLIHGVVTEKKILETLTYAKSTFKTPVWENGLEIMSKIKENTSMFAIGLQFANALESLSISDG